VFCGTHNIEKKQLVTRVKQMPNKFLSVFSLITAFTISSLASGGTLLRMQTDLGGVDIELFDTATPLTVENFLFYVNGGLDGQGYDGTFIHRRAKLDDAGVSVLQMGGSIFNPANGAFTNNDGINHIPVKEAVVNEPGISNLRGTFAMAKVAGQPDSARAEFFFNLIDNTILDTLESGFTVFGEVLGDGMEVIDAIADLERCKDIGFNLPSPCNAFPQVPLVAIEADNGAIFTTPVVQKNLVNLVNIGIDTDGDGVIDRVEDAAPNNGDMNNDAVADGVQTNTASFQTISGDYISIELPQGSDLSSTDVLGQTFALTTVDPFDANNELAGLTILQGFFATKISGIFNGDAITLTLALPADNTPNTFFSFGPTLDNTTPHWYEFKFDGETGAQINNNVVTIHFIDGKRGDADLQPNGEIKVSPGGPARKPGDADGIPDSVEDNAPNNGDGNNDGVPDSEQSHVASLTDIRGNYITLEASPLVLIQSVRFSIGTEFLAQAQPANQLAGLNFSHGFLAFNIVDMGPGNATDVKLILPAGEQPISYYKFGPTPENPDNHLYEFIFDGETGAEFNNNVVTLHFVDGKRGDSDLTANGVIVDPGAPALRAEVTGADSGGGGGCTIAREDHRPAQAGAWWLLLVLTCLYGTQPVYRRYLSIYS
jgi:cyclophilin family peptidyl-prolyl cis-trans isomerase